MRPGTGNQSNPRGTIRAGVMLKGLFGGAAKEKNRNLLSGRTGKDAEHAALFQVSTAIKAQKDISAILEIIGRESARCLKAQRSTVYLVDVGKGVLKSQFTYSPDHPDNRQGLPEDKEIARQAIVEKRAILLKDPGEFPEFFKKDERSRKVTSLLSVPFGVQGKMIGAVNLFTANGRRNFDEKDLQFLSIFANHASIALQNQYLLEEVRKAASLRQNYERYLDDLMHQLQSLSGEERRRIDEHIGRFLSGLKADKPVPANPVEKSAAGEKGVINLAGEMSFEDSPENLTEKVQVEIEDFIGKPGADVSRAGVFIPTGNPRDLGEQFILRLHLSEGRLLELPCKVIFTNKYGKESQNLRRGMGIKFLELPKDVQKQLEDYVRLCKEQRGSTPEEPDEPTPPKEEETEIPAVELKFTSDPG